MVLSKARAVQRASGTKAALFTAGALERSGSCVPITSTAESDPNLGPLSRPVCLTDGEEQGEVRGEVPRHQIRRCVWPNT